MATANTPRVIRSSDAITLSCKDAPANSLGVSLQSIDNIDLQVGHKKVLVAYSIDLICVLLSKEYKTLTECLLEFATDSSPPTCNSLIRRAA